MYENNYKIFLICIPGGMAELVEVITIKRDSLKVNVFCTISKTKVYRSFFFIEKTVDGSIYLDMSQLRSFPQLAENSMNFVYQQEGAPPY